MEEKIKTLLFAMNNNDNLIYITNGKCPIAIEVFSMPWSGQSRIAIRANEKYRIRKARELTTQEINDLENQLH